jgi:hypothetical protein
MWKLKMGHRQQAAVKGACGLKTPCTSAVLDYMGIDKSKFRYSQFAHDVVRILRNNGYSVRSRKSSIPKGSTVGSCRKRLMSLGPVDAKYMVFVKGHVLMLNVFGTTVVDTAGRKADRRKITKIYMVVKSS